MIFMNQNMQGKPDRASLKKTEPEKNEAGNHEPEKVPSPSLVPRTAGSHPDWLGHVLKWYF